MSEPYVFIIGFRIPGATEPDEYSVRAYDDERLQDMALMGPDEHGVFDAEFEREGDSFAAVVRSGLTDLAAGFPEAEILELRQDNLVSLAAIARRLGRSHESVRLYARGKRGPGGFPAPAARLDGKTEVWRWPEVGVWWREVVGEPVEQLEEDLFLTMLNDALEIRRVAGEINLEPAHAAAIAAVLPDALRGEPPAVSAS
jgi:hypothetical protein